MPKKAESIFKRFIRKIERVKGTSQCWIWKGCIMTSGYGYMSVGSLHGISKLKESNILEIFNLRNKGFSQHEIARIFKINQTGIGKILRRETWSHVNVPQSS